MSINWREISWWIVAAASVLHVYAGAHHIISHF
jgi:hypothetical protein